MVLRVSSRGKYHFRNIDIPERYCEEPDVLRTKGAPRLNIFKDERRRSRVRIANLLERRPAEVVAFHRESQ